MKITQQAFNEWVEKYYNEFQPKLKSGEMTWTSFGKSVVAHNYSKPEGILLINIKNGKTARSYCHDDDKWDTRIGIAVAYARYMGVEIPQVERTYLIKELVGKEIIIEGYKYYITPYGNTYYMYAIDEFGKVYHLSRIRVVFESEIVSEKKE